MGIDATRQTLQTVFVVQHKTVREIGEETVSTSRVVGICDTLRAALLMTLAGRDDIVEHDACANGPETWDAAAVDALIESWGGSIPTESGGGFNVGINCTDDVWQGFNVYGTYLRTEHPED